MPLAIELAAPWLRTLTPAQLAERLDDRFALLTNGSRASLPRHQTLRATVDWSWQLLSGPERALARRLAVFPGGATLTAAEQVCPDQAPEERPAPAGQPTGRALLRAEVLTALSGLVGKSILTMTEPSDDGAPRYRMLETVRAYALERLAEAGEEDAVRDALAGYFCELAETADPLLRTADQMRWFHLLSAEQDNMQAALRWAVARGDAGTALRLVRALGYYWVQLGHGEGDGLAREVLALTPPDPPTKTIAEARVICAMLAAGWSYDLESVKEQLIEGIAGIAAWSDDPGSLHPLAAMAEPLLLQFTGGRELVQQVYDRYATAGDPWLRAMGMFYRAQHASEMGRVDGVEAELQAALRDFRAIGERWGAALVLTILADLSDLRADDAATIAALEEAVSIGRELNAWGDLAYIEARLAINRARTGELARARAELDQAARAALARRGQIDVDRWVTFMRTELAWREGDLAAVVDYCLEVLTAFDSYQAVWWEPLRARIRGRLAMAVLAQGDEGRCRELLAAALDAAAAWTEHPPLAAVLDACACYALRRPGRPRPQRPPRRQRRPRHHRRTGRARRPAARRGPRRPRRLRRVEPGRPAGPRRRQGGARPGRLRCRLPVRRGLDLPDCPRPSPRGTLITAPSGAADGGDASIRAEDEPEAECHRNHPPPPRPTASRLRRAVNRAWPVSRSQRSPRRSGRRTVPGRAVRSKQRRRPAGRTCSDQ